MRVLLLAAVLALFVAPAASAAKVKRCGDLGDMVGAINAKGIGCKKAIEIVAAHQEGVKQPAGFKCRSSRYEGGTTWTCRKSGKRIRYSRAD